MNPQTSVRQPADHGRVIGLDLGERRIGVALCDQARTVATPIATLDRRGDRSVEHAALGRLMQEYEVDLLVVGLPLSLSGELGPAARKVLTEVKSLRKRLGVSVVTHDERLSTVTAQASLHDQGWHGRKGGKGRRVIDQVAAAVILQSWIDTQYR